MSASKGNKAKPKEQSVREQIFHSMIASFKIEGIHIPADKALASFKKVELTLGK